MTALLLVRRAIAGSPFKRPLAWVRDAVLSRVPVTNSGFCWIKEGNGISTRLYVYNYWSENYGVPSVRLRWTLFDAAGRRRGTGVRTLAADATAVIAGTDLLRDAGVASPFEGNVVCELTDRRLKAGRPVQMLGEYLGDDGTASCVHSQWGFFDRNRPRGAAGGHMHVLADEDYETVIVPQNCSRSRRDGGLANAPRVTIYNAAGEARTVTLPPVASGGFAHAAVRDLVEDPTAFFGGRSGNVRVEMATPSIRAFHYHRRRDGAISVNHGAGDYASFPERVRPTPRATCDALGLASLAVAPAWNEHCVTSRYVLHNNYVPVGAYAFDVRLYDTAGTMVAERKQAIHLAPRETRVVTLRELVGETGDAPFRGTAQFALALHDGATAYPPSFQLVVELWAAGRVAATDAGSDLFNAPGASGQRTKIFGRVVESASYETWICLAYPSADRDNGRPSATTVSLMTADSAARRTTTVALRPQGAVFARIGDLFDGAAEYLGAGQGVGLVKVRDTTAWLYGYHLLRHRGTGALATDHLIGG